MNEFPFNPTGVPGSNDGLDAAMSKPDDEKKAPWWSGQGANQKSAWDGNCSEIPKTTPCSSNDQVAEMLKRNVPAELQERAQWVTWKLVEKEGAKRTKIPFNARTHKPASTTDPSTWSTFDTALQAYRHGGFAGLGFVFSNNDPYVGIDFDHVLSDGSWDQEVIHHIFAISGYTETSPSGDGAHVITKANVTLNCNRRGFGNESGFEVYTEGRYFTVTGDAWPDVHAKTIRDATNEVISCCKHFLGSDAIVDGSLPFAEHPDHEMSTGGGKVGPGPSTIVSAGLGSDDLEEQVEAVIDKARRARNGSKFSKLFDDGDLGDYAGDHSVADLALCGILAYWSRNNPALIDQAFRRSKLMRQKWDSLRGNQTYGQITVDTALSKGDAGSQRAGGGREKLPETIGDETPESDAPLQNTYKCTDLGNAERFARDHGENVRYVHSWGQWLVWDGKRWKKDSTGEIVRLAKKTVRKIYNEAAQIQDETIRAAVGAWARKSESKERVKAMIELARAEARIAITHEALDAKPYLLNCINGTLCLKTAGFREHRREDHLTKLSPVEFRADAACPKWLQFLNTIMGGDAELIAFLKRFSGYSLTGDVTEQCLAFLYGTGANGKSTFVETLSAVFGDYFQRAPTSLIAKRPDGSDGIPNDIARLPGARMVVTPEVEEGSRIAESRVKDLTGGDRLTARFLRQEFFEFDPTHKLWIYGNHRPYIVGTDLGIWRRILQIPFEVTIPEKDRDSHLKEKLIATELPGILAWCVSGCLEWGQMGLKPPMKVSSATEEYRAEMDTVGHFIEERCLCSPTAKTGKDELYRAYHTWSEECGMRPLSKNRFGRRLKEKLFDDDRSGGQRFWIGLAIQPEF